MKHSKTCLGLLPASALLMFSSCTSQSVTLVHPQSGATVECSGSGTGLAAPAVHSYIEDCMRRNENKGYVPVEKLTPEQRDDLQRRGLLPRS